MSVVVFEGFLSTPEMVEVFDETALVQAMMDFEAALARAQAKAGVIPTGAAQAIASLCRAELYDVAAMLAASGPAACLAQPVVRKLSETVALFDPLAAAYVHWGSSSQDLLDTAMVLQTRKALQLIEQDLLALCGRLLDLAERHARTAMLARTQMQPARVTSLRYKLLAWVSPLLRCAQALRERSADALLLQLGGTVGTLSALGGAAEQVGLYMAEELQLRLPTMPWHTQRDRWLRLGTELGVLCGALGKLATDLTLLSQAELAELTEALPPGRPGTAAATPRHRPMGSLQALAAARRAPQRVAALLGCMAQEHERGLGNWPAEMAEWAGLLVGTHGAVKSLARVAAGLQVHGARMLENIDAQQDLIFSDALQRLIAGCLGPVRAQAWVEALVVRVQRGEGPLRLLARSAAAADTELVGRLVPAELEAVFDVHGAAQQADQRVQAALLEARALWTGLQDGLRD